MCSVSFFVFFLKIIPHLCVKASKSLYPVCIYFVLCVCFHFASITAPKNNYNFCVLKAASFLFIFGFSALRFISRVSTLCKRIMVTDSTAQEHGVLKTPRFKAQFTALIGSCMYH